MPGTPRRMSLKRVDPLDISVRISSVHRGVSTSQAFTMGQNKANLLIGIEISVDQSLPFNIDVSSPESVPQAIVFGRQGAYQGCYPLHRRAPVFPKQTTPGLTRGSH